MPLESYYRSSRNARGRQDFGEVLCQVTPGYNAKFGRRDAAIM